MTTCWLCPILRKSLATWFLETSPGCPPVPVCDQCYQHMHHRNGRPDGYAVARHATTPGLDPGRDNPPQLELKL